MKKIFSILLILLTLSLTLSTVSAEDVMGDVNENVDIVAASEDVVTVSADEGNAAGGEDALATSDTPSADLTVDTEVLDETGGVITWGVYVYNNGPDTAQNTIVYNLVSDNLIAFDYLASQGAFDYDYCFWEVGNLAAGEEALMYLYTLVLGDGPHFNKVIVSSDTHDSDLSNNHDISSSEYENNSVSATEKTLPKTGNPLVLALMALMVIGVGGLRRLY